MERGTWNVERGNGDGRLNLFPEEASAAPAPVAPASRRGSPLDPLSREGEGAGGEVPALHSRLATRDSQLFAEIIVDQPGGPLERTFTYSVPERLAGRLTVGSYVRVPFGRQRLGGYVVGLTDQAPAVKLRAIEDLLLDEPVFGAAELALAERIAAAYFCPLASALRLILPPGAARKPEQLIVLPHPLPPLLAGEGVEKKRGARQGAVVQALVAAGGEVERRTLERAADLGAGAAGVLRGLEERGLIRIQRRLRRSGAGPLSRRAVRLRIPSGVAQASKPAAAEGEAGLEACATPEAAAEALERTAPRQAAILRELAGRGPLPLAELPRASVLGLEERGLVDVYDQPQRRKPADQSYELPAARPVPTPAQAAALDRVETALERHEYWGALLHGVTGSGKTEVYLGALERALAQGRGAIVLVPEISLTPQTVGRFAARFGDRIAVLHSSLGAGERFDEWERARTGEARVVIGARSALFAPVADLGIIVVDEEHEPSYKQDAVPRYNAISVAQWRAEQAGAVLLLGSATPALEHYWAACNPADSQVVPDLRLTLLELPERIGGRPLPEVRTLDLRGETAIGPNSTLAEDLREAIAERLERGEQVMLFLNRRGYSTFVMCRECGFVLTCPDCAVALIYHRESGTMRCHHCDHAQLAPEECPNCQGVDIGFRGLGTERVADQIGRQFPDHPILRLDKDTTAAKGAYGQILGQFARGEAQILIGTQMIAKGHDFPEVTLVGVINADVGLYRPDFRAAERTFQLLTQVSGRAGRADKLGQVYVQTYNPDHYALQAAAQHDYAAFYQVEIAARREHQYPPFTKLASVVFSHPVEETAHEAARQAAVSLQDLGLEHSHGAVQFVGPGACPLHKLRGRYRYQILLKAPDYATLTRLLRDLLDRLERPEDLRVTVDVDPADMM